MALKRRCTEREGDGSEIPVQESKRAFNAVRAIQGLLLDEADLIRVFEPLLRRVVQEEVERSILLFLRPSPRLLNPIDSSELRRWQLQFVNNLPSSIYTGNSLISKDNGPIEIVLVDAITNTRVTSGPLSSLKVEIVVLGGGFSKGDQEDWTEEEFKDHVVLEREGKRPLVTGELIVPLSNGVGCIGDISFTDNSSWIRGRRFRLGARILQNVSSEVRIREARSESFVVKDHRGESYKKHHPPSLGDEVWRLERIGKNGKFHNRLGSKGIYTLKDFLQLYFTNPSLLRKILGGRISNGKWDTIIDHATTCVLDDTKLYFYYITEYKAGLLFNSVYKVVGGIFDGNTYQPLDILNTSQKNFVEKMKQLAYQNVNCFVPFNDFSLVGPSMQLSCPQEDPLSGTGLGMQRLEFQNTFQDQLGTQQDFYHPCSTSLTYEDINQIEMHYPGQFPITTTLDQGNSFFFPSSSRDEGECSYRSPQSYFNAHYSCFGKPKVQWCKIRAAIKWKIIVRRKLAAKRMTHIKFLACH